MTQSFLSNFIDIVISIFVALIFIRVILSWVTSDFEHPAAKFIFEVTEPILAPIRKILPQAGMLDFSPLVAMIALEVLGQVLHYLITIL